MKKTNLPLSAGILENMNAFECLWECNKNHLNEVIITYRADLNVLDRNKQTLYKKITYKDLFKNIIKTVDSLKKLGVKKGDVVTYASITTPELIYTMYACIIIGAIFDPIDPREKEEGLLRHFKNEPSKIYFAPEKMFDSTRNVYGDLGVEKIIIMSFMESLPLPIKIGSKFLDKKNGVKPFIAPNEQDFMNWYQFNGNSKIDRNIKINSSKFNDLASFTHTTGTTGIPKTLMHTNENWNAQYYNITTSGLKFIRGERFFNVTVPWVDFGLINSLHAFLCNGIRLDFDPTWTPDKNVDYYLKYAAEWWMGAPGWIDPLFTDKKYENANPTFGRYIITGGAPLFEHKQKLYASKMKNEFNSECQIVQGYGLSEVTAAAFLDLNNDAGTLGKPMPLYRCEIKDPDTFETVEDGKSGELWLSAANSNLSTMAVGYKDNEEETNKTFVFDENGIRWVRTGDKVHKNANGTYTWESRYKNILTFNGFNINCSELLDAVEKLDGVGTGAIIGAVTSDGNQRPIVCFETDEYMKGHEDIVQKNIEEMIVSTFPEYYVPLDIIAYDKIPTKTMKIDYSKLKEDNLNANGEYKKILTKDK